MSFVNFGTREITFKIVYYGPALSGKTTNLERIHTLMPKDVKGEMAMLSTQQDRTLYFDFLPLKSNAIKGYTSKFQLYTVPGQPIYDRTRRLVLTGADGVVFVADSQWDQMQNNVESLEDFKNNLKLHNTTLEEMPYILQFNKRDLDNVAPPHYLDFLLNQGGKRVTFVNAVAKDCIGVDTTLNIICKMVMAKFIQDNNISQANLEQESSIAVEKAEANES